ncbi:MAG: zinc ribbon domain-containing protein [bacterium]|nr:zinc ribbon domain-containing protein [bacterium]
MLKMIEWMHKQLEPNLRDMPEAIKRGIQEKYEEDTVLLTLKSDHIRHEGLKFTSSDNNTFYQSWLVLTDKRIIAARNSSTFKEFVSTPYAMLEPLSILFSFADGMLTFNEKNGKSYKVEFLKYADEYFEELDITLREMADRAQHKKCPHCGREIEQESNFCPGCGRDISL